MAKDRDNKYSKGYKPARGNGFYYVIGLVLVGVAVLLLFQTAQVRTVWYTWRVGGLGLPMGVSVVPLLIGIGLFFYKPGWLAAKIVIAIGVLFILLTLLFSVRITFPTTSLFNYVLMFGSLAGGAGFLLRGLFSRQ